MSIPTLLTDASNFFQCNIKLIASYFSPGWIANTLHKDSPWGLFDTPEIHTNLEVWFSQIM